MSTTPSIACTLSATGLSERLVDMRDLGTAALLTADRTDTIARLRFQLSDDVHARLAAIVAAEAHCCAFLRFDLRPDRDALLLTIESPADDAAQLTLHELVDAFVGRTPEPAP